MSRANRELGPAVGSVLYARYTLFRGAPVSIPAGAPIVVEERHETKASHRRKDRFGHWTAIPASVRLRVNYKGHMLWVNPEDLTA